MPVFKYAQELTKIPNCPNKNCNAKDLEAYRWIHKEVSEKDFVPLSIIDSPPQRILDKSDILYISYGLSFFITKDLAQKKYIDEYNKRARQHLKEQFKSDKGESIALISLTISDGVASEPVSNGHFTFWEYSGVNFLDKIKGIFDIFDIDDSIENI